MALILWRIVRRKYENFAFEGYRAKRFGGRWNSPGTSVIYASTSKSESLLAVLENTSDPKDYDFIAIPIIVPSTVHYKRVELQDLPSEWHEKFSLEATQRLGDRLLSEKSFAVFLIPSALVYGEYIALIDPFHEDFTQIIPAPAESIFWSDKPLLESKIMMIDSYKDVFICHAHEDKKSIVEPLYRALFSNGISCWYDNAEIKWGDSITEKVSDGLSKSEYVIVVLTENFMKRNWPRRELMTALDKEASTGKVVVLPLVAGTNQFQKQIQQDLFLQSDKLYVEWNNNSEEIASILRDRLRTS